MVHEYLTSFRTLRSCLQEFLPSLFVCYQPLGFAIAQILRKRCLSRHEHEMRHSFCGVVNPRCWLRSVRTVLSPYNMFTGLHEDALIGTPPLVSYPRLVEVFARYHPSSSRMTLLRQDQSQLPSSTTSPSRQLPFLAACSKRA